MDRVSEWLQADGRGGFASGTASGIRTRRYHALLAAATRPPAGRMVLVNGFDAWAGGEALSSQLYTPGVVHPDGSQRISSFRSVPWPCWTFRLSGGLEVVQEIIVSRRRTAALVSWKLLNPAGTLELVVRPLISGRDMHALHRENAEFRFEASVGKGLVSWSPYRGVPTIFGRGNGRYQHEPVWYRNFLYEEERARGLDCVEDLASPGLFRWDLSQGEAILALMTDEGVTEDPAGLLEAERRERAGVAPRLAAADAYVVRRNGGKTIVAGYPWFGDWGRDTFIALRGLCLATGRIGDAREILLEWSRYATEGMLPNRFPDSGGGPEYTSVDASLWFIVAASELMKREGRIKALEEACRNILRAYSGGCPYGIGLDGDGLIRAGEPGVQLTWMDARVDGRVVTPRMGKPVEVQALWLNALALSGPEWRGALQLGLASFRKKFWNGAWLYDCIDPPDASFRPNQIFAIGGLPLPILEGEPARLVVEAVRERLVTPMGLRSLAPGEPGYRGRYEGGVRERDEAYHQGTVWPWLMGPFLEAYARVYGPDEARKKFLEPFLALFPDGHIPEIADGDPPHRPGGCPFQAWSLGEALRLERLLQ